MKKIKGPAIFLAQFIGDQAPFNSLAGLAQWAASLGYKGLQIPTWDKKIFDLEKAAQSQSYCDEITGLLEKHDLVVTELSTHLQGQLVAVHPAYNEMFDAFAPEAVHGKAKQRTEWATQQVKLAAKASQRLNLKNHVSFPGALLWPTVYPWPQRPNGLVEEAFAELARRWTPILDVFDECDVNLGFELHPGEDLHDGYTFEKFLEVTKQHPRLKINYDPSHFVLQQMDYLGFIDLYHPWINAFHVKDAEFIPNARGGVYGGYQSWVNRPGRFRSLGDGQIDFKSIFSKLSQYNFDGWAVVEWECCIKSPEQGAREGAQFVKNHIIDVTQKAFDDFAGAADDAAKNRRILGLE